MITVAAVNKRFGRVVALDGVSFGVAPGERVAFVGANGSGKTTLLRALLGLVRVEGKITIGGADVAREPEVALRSVAYIPQIAPPIDAPVREVVRAYAALRGIAVDDIRAEATRLTLDLAASEKKRFRDLSGGMKQKLLAAMALATRAAILVCDEPTANLDGDARAAFFEALASRPKTDTVILCSHRIEEVQRLVDRVIELGDGRVVRDASLTELLRDLRAFRVEVAIRDGARDVETFLRAREFAAAGARRFVARVAQDEKLDVVTRLLRDFGGDVEDVSVVPVEDLSAAAPSRARRPRRDSTP
jgi:ABC-type multidrug transport system ATPase subunit